MNFPRKNYEAVYDLFYLLTPLVSFYNRQTYLNVLKVFRIKVLEGN